MQETYKPKACAYVRVSTSSRAQENSFAFQSVYWDDYMKAQPDYEYVGLYADEGISAKTNKTRKQFLQMLDDACEGKINRIFTKSYTRFGRSDTETLETIRLLREHGVSVYFDTEKLDTADPNSDFVIGILSSVAREELIQDSENLKWAINNRYRKGAVYINNKMLGLKFVNQKIEVDETQRWIVEKIFNLYLDGNGIEKIARILNIEKVPTATGKDYWYTGVVRRILSNEKYVGDSLQHKVYKNLEMKAVKNRGEVPQYYIQNNHEAIISREMFDKVQQMLIQRRNENSVDKQVPTYPFSHKIVCGHDGHHFRRKFEGYKEKRGIYKCSLYLAMTKVACNNSAILESVLEEKFVSAYNEYIDNIKEDDSVEELKQQLRNNITKERKLKALFINKYLTREKYQELSDSLIKANQELDLQLKAKLKKFNKMVKDIKIDEFNAKMVEKHLEKAEIMDYSVKFIFKNGYTTIRSYDNGKSGNRRKSNNPDTSKA